MAQSPRDPLGPLGGLFAPAPIPAKPGAPVFEVSALSQRIREQLEGGIGAVKVRGEVSNARCVSGHWYFSLKDESARIDCILFRADAARSESVPRDGARVIAQATVTHYPPQGRTQLQCTRLEEAGAGDLNARFKALCEELRQKGYFDESRKKKIPSVPMCIAILTSAGSAAEADCLNAAAQTFPAAKLILVDVRVQGAQAATGIASAIDAVDAAASRLGIEVILLVRGGGSIEDLWAFNERPVADAILRAQTPIVSGIGHETDTTIADFVADRRAPTPSRAITETLPNRQALQEEVDSLSHRLVRGWGHSHARAVGRVELAARSRALSDPAAGIAVRCALVDQWSQGLLRAAARVLERATSHATAIERTLGAVSPYRVLDRGYSITLDASGHAVRAPEQVRLGESIRTIVAEGELASMITATSAGEPNSHVLGSHET